MCESSGGMIIHVSCLLTQEATGIVLEIADIMASVTGDRSP
jgi:hypothetical protein